MIALHSDCLLFQLTNGESVPCSADMITVEVVGEVRSLLDPEMLQHAAASVFHYFRVELERETVTVGEFSLALEKVLHHLGYTLHASVPAIQPGDISDTDLARLVTRNRRPPGAFFLPASARRTSHPAPPIAARRAVSRPARLRETDCRRAALEPALRTIGGSNRVLPPRMSQR